MGVAEIIAESVLKRVFDVWDRKAATKERRPRTFEDALSRHLVEATTWSNRIDIFGLVGRDTDASTVDLFISLPRKFRGPKRTRSALAEAQLLASTKSYIVLGDPGAGKTTTLKRLTRHLLLEPDTPSDSSHFPIVIRLRELSSARLLQEALADVFAIDHDRHPVVLDAKRNEERDPLLSTHSVVQLPAPVKPFVVTSGGEPVEQVVARRLDDTGALVLLDGLDETPPEVRPATERAIDDIMGFVTEARFVITCRSGDYTRVFPGFKVVEICPLTAQQIDQIAQRWCSKPKKFIKRLRELPFADLASRPLFLCQLIRLYETTGFLPVDASAVYQRVIRLALEEWDRQKRVDRDSRYSNFDPDRKLKFLSHLAFHLTYKLRAKQFTTPTLSAAYEAICDNFGLPSAEALSVAQELETHTGILIESGIDRFEFSHLSLQEYLCARHLVAAPTTDAVADYIVHDPAPVAVASAISSDPSEWLGALFLRRSVTRNLDRVNLQSFFSRVAREAPEIGASEMLGRGALRILFRSTQADEYTRWFLDLRNVRISIAGVLASYNAIRHDNGYRVQLYPYKQSTGDFDIPARGWISDEWLEATRRITPLKFRSLRAESPSG